MSHRLISYFIVSVDSVPPTDPYAWRLLMMMALTLSSFHAFEMEIAGYTSKKN